MAAPMAGSAQPCFYCQKTFRTEVLDQHLRECRHRQDFSRRVQSPSTEAEKPKADLLQKWECPLCTYENDCANSICEVCRSGQRPTESDLWRCTTCTYANNKALTACKLCATPRGGQASAPSSPQHAAPSGPSQPVRAPARAPPRQEPPQQQDPNPFEQMAQRQPPPPPVGRPAPRHDPDDPFADPEDPHFVREHRNGNSIGEAQPMHKQASDDFQSLPALPPSSLSAQGVGAQDMDVDDAKVPPVPPPPEEDIVMQQAAMMDVAHNNVEDDEASARLIAQLMQQQACGKCGEPATFDLPCNHLMCNNCVSQYLRNGLVRQTWKSEPLTCPVDGCEMNLPSWAVRDCGISENHRNKIEEMQTQFLTSSMDNLIKCPKCPNIFEGEAGDIMMQMANRRSQAAAHQIEIGLDGKPLSRTAMEHKAAYRFRCGNCNTIFCKQCKVFPYHLGYTCESWESYQNANKCRFCSKRLEAVNTARPDPHNNGPGLQSVCTDAECISKRELACSELLQCGHPCCGIKGERGASHLPCLTDPECPNAQGVDGEDYCNICWVEALNQAPCVRLGCGHFFHFSCVREKIERKWPGARVTFGFLNCPLCKQEIHHPAISAHAQEYFSLKEKIKVEAVERLQIEGLHEDQRLRDPNSPYFNNTEEFALDRLAYYLCFKCGKPYFGGMRACEEAGAQQDENYNREHLVCPGCASGPNSKSCPRHGKKYITYKCKFCCSIASWFCWGNTHFCDGCHKKQERGDYLNRKPIDQLPRCPGMPDCPLAVQHPPNGVEDFALGCVVCLRR